MSLFVLTKGRDPRITGKKMPIAGSPSFTTSPFEMRDATIISISTGPNQQARWINSDSSLRDTQGNLEGGGAPQQFGTAFPGPFPLPDPATGFPYKLRWIEDNGPDTPNQSFPGFNIFRDINTTFTIGFNLAAGQTRTANVVVEGYNGDATIILARARYEIIATRTF